MPAPAPGAGIAEHLGTVRRRLAAAAARAGRAADRITLVAVSKTFSADRVRQAAHAGQRQFGENRVQEGLAKAPALPADCVWHLLGPLQTNKARAAVPLFSLFEAVDREKVARALDAEAARAGRLVEALAEINLGGEESKHGFAPAGIEAALAPLAGLPHLRLVGLMTIPPPAADPQAARPWFRRLRAMRDALDARPEWAGRLVELSMGMSDDFEVAIEEGATYVRIGTALFGPRAPTP
jgi:pyridoxal phosphate enzyme (YggS family)